MEQNTSSKHAARLIVVGTGALIYCLGFMHSIRSQQVIQMSSCEEAEALHTLQAQENTMPRKLGGRADGITGGLEITEQASFMLKGRESLS